MKRILLLSLSLHTAYVLSQQVTATQLQANALLDVGKLFYQQKNYAQALRYLEKAEQTGEPFIQKEAEDTAEDIIGYLSQQTELYLASDKPNHFAAYLNLEIMSEQNFNTGVKYNALQKIGDLFLEGKLGNTPPTLAVPYYVELSKQTDNFKLKMDAELKLAGIFLADTMYASAKDLFKKLAHYKDYPAVQKFAEQKIKEIEDIEKMMAKKKKKKQNR